MRSSSVGYAPHLGIFLRDLEDKVEVAKIQERILNQIATSRSNYDQAQQAIQKLNCGLYDLTQVIRVVNIKNSLQYTIAFKNTYIFKIYKLY